jgi:hypothetical protein
VAGYDQDVLDILRLDFVPVVYVAARETGISDAELARALAQLLIWLRDDHTKQRRIVSIIDLSRARLLNAKQRTVMHEWLQDARAMTIETSLGVAFIAPSSLVRGVLTAIFWFQSLGAPHAITGSLGEAVTWSVERLAQARIPLPCDARSDIERALATVQRAKS